MSWHRHGPGRRHRRWHHRRHRHHGCRYAHGHDHSGAHLRPFRRYVHARLHRRLFVWFGVSIAMTALVVSAAVWLGSSGRAPWKHYLDRVDVFVGDRFVEVWEQPQKRAALTRSLARTMRGARVHGADGRLLDQAGEPCTEGVHRFLVSAPGGASGGTDSDKILGTVEICPRFEHRGGPVFLLLVLLAGAASLWLATGVIARRLVRPLGVMARVARDIGDGRLDSRVPTGARGTGELAVLACAINDMAEHIANQLAEQRELLAAVSHELRTPLGHMRVIVEMMAENPDGPGNPEESEPSPESDPTPGPAQALAMELEREVVEMDALVGQLLASSRLSFEAVDERPLNAVELATRALERANADPTLLVVEGLREQRRHVLARSAVDIIGDATLLARALANLLSNAQRHGRGVAAMRVVVERTDQFDAHDANGDESEESGIAGFVRFEVDDRGPGFAEDEQTRVFETFYRGQRRAGSASLGLGLSLVRRIAEAHGGNAWAENLPDGGARVGFSVSLTPDETGE